VQMYVIINKIKLFIAKTFLYLRHGFARFCDVLPKQGTAVRFISIKQLIGALIEVFVTFCLNKVQL
jgi:hypothetical protein